MTGIDKLDIEHARFVEARDALHEALLQSQVGSPWIVSVCGPSRVGKTRVIDSCVEVYGEGGELSGKEILRVVSPKYLTGRALPDACLESLGLRASFYKNQLQATQALVKALARAETKLIIFDETQHMIERSGSTSVRAAGDFLKTLFDEARTSIALVGLPELLRLFDVNEQLRNRARTPVRYYPYSYQGKEYVEFRRALAGAMSYFLDMGWDTYKVDDPCFAKRMYLASAGRFGMVIKILAEVERNCSTTKKATQKHFAKAFADTAGFDRQPSNPFSAVEPISIEQLAKVYSSVMHEAGLAVGGASVADFT